MTNPVLHPFDGSPSHPQSLDHFALNDLLHRLKTYVSEAGISLETQELESLAALLIQTLVANLDDDLLASYLEAIRHHKFEALIPNTLINDTNRGKSQTHWRNRWPGSVE